MIPCRFIYQLPTGKPLDYHDQVLQVLAIPRIGDTIFIFQKEEDKEGRRTKVKEVVFSFNPTENSHEVIVYHGE